MKKTDAKNMRKEERTDTIIGIITVLAILAAFTLIIIFAGNRTSGEIAHAGEVRRGNQQTFTYKSKNLKKGDLVTWYVDNQKMDSYRYDGNSANFTYTPNKTGNSTVRVVSGKYNQSKLISVGKPVLTLTAKDATVVYGDQLPQFEYDWDGLVGTDSLESLNCKISCITKDDANCCGEKEIVFEPVECENYEVRYNNARLTVLPREIHIENVIEKQYDQTNTLENAQVSISGVVNDDDVDVVVGKLFFDDKNVGEYQLSTANIQLVGENCQNYVLCDDVRGKIVPKGIVLEGLTVSDKRYDGTTKANISKLGRLNGVYDGDSVAIGSLEISFGDASIGEKIIVVKNVTLVGMDKDNYFVEDVVVGNASILEK